MASKLDRIALHFVSSIEELTLYVCVCVCKCACVGMKWFSFCSGSDETNEADEKSFKYSLAVPDKTYLMRTLKTLENESPNCIENNLKTVRSIASKEVTFTLH